MTKRGFREALKEIRKRGMTVSGWARTHGYKPDSVFKILYGIYGKPGPMGKAILYDLGREGFIKRKPGDRGVRKSA